MNKSRQVLMARLLASGTVIALCATPVAAQQSENLFQMLGRIILSAGKAKVAIETPQAVTALEQEDFDQLQANSPAELLKGVPGVQTTGSSVRPMGQAFNIRGIGVNDTAASEDRIKVNVDGAPKFFEAYRMGSFFGDLDLYKRVEVLRGPASSTLYGSGAIGGVVSFTTKDAADFLAEGESNALRFKVDGTSNGDGSNLGFLWANRVGNSEFLAAFNGTRSDLVKDGGGAIIRGTKNKSHSALVKQKLTFGNDNDQSLTFSWSRTDTDLKDAEVLQIGGNDFFFDMFGLHDVHTVDDTATLTLNYGFADNQLLDVTAQLSFSNTDVKKNNFHGGSVSCAPGNISILCDSEYGYRTIALKLENTADLSVGAWENYLTTGVQLSRQDRTAQVFDPIIASGMFDFHPQGEDERIAAYVRGELTWNERLTLIPGLRIERGSRTPDARITGAAPVDDTASSISLSALYKLNDNLSLFGTLAQTERLPTLDELYTRSATQKPAINLEKEEARSIEFGTAYQKQGLFAADDVLQVKVTGFHNDFRNMVTRGTAPEPYHINTGHAKIWGAELEASYDAERWFGSIAWSKVKSQDVAKRNQLAETPAENVAVTLGAKFPEQNLVVGWRGYYFDNIRTGAALTMPGGAFPVAGKAYDTHDIFVSWKPQEGALAGIAVNLAVENVFDKEYINNLAQDKGVGRNAKLSISKTFTW